MAESTQITWKWIVGVLIGALGTISMAVLGYIMSLIHYQQVEFQRSMTEMTREMNILAVNDASQSEFQKASMADRQALHNWVLAISKSQEEAAKLQAANQVHMETLLKNQEEVKQAVKDIQSKVNNPHS